MSYFPDNTTSCFTTHLPREIKLHSEWLVDLVEIHVPCSVVHFQEADAFYTFVSYEGSDRVEKKHCNILVGIYDSLAELADAINSSNETYRHQMLETVKTRRGYYAIRRKCDCPQAHVTYLNEKIRRIFGFDDTREKQKIPFMTLNDNVNDDDAGQRDIVAARLASLSQAIPDQLYVYTDICEPYTVGDTQAALLRIVSMDTFKFRYGCNAVQRFAPAHYISLLYHNFNNVVIDIRDQHGHHIPFEYGTLTVTLHFRHNQ